MKKRLRQNCFELFLILVTIVLSTNSTAQTVQTFNSSGTWLCPAGVTSVFVESWGAGGAGGGIAVAATGGAGGGGGGSYSKTVLTLVPGNTYNYVVGSSGLGGTGAGPAGGSSSFNGVVVAAGGAGGNIGPSGTAGVGGTGYDFNGGTGSPGVSGTRGGAGGGGAGSAAAGGAASNATAGVGGTGGGGTGGAGKTSSNAGNAGSSVGGGGGGAFNNLVSPGYNGGNGANGQISLTYCSSIATNTATVTTTSFDWSIASSWTLNHVPTICENAVIIVDRTAAVTNETVNLTIPSLTVQSLTIRNISASPYQVLVSGNVATSSTVNIYGNLTVETVGGTTTGNPVNRTSFGGTTCTFNVYGNVTLGRSAATASIPREGHSTIVGNPSTWNVYGNLTFNPKGYNTNRGTVFNFNSGGTQYMINNTNPPVYNDTTKGDRFETLNIGNTNPTTLILSGINDDFHISSLIAGDLNVGVNSTLDLPENYSFNMVSLNGSTTSNFRLKAGALLRIGGDQSLTAADGTNLGVAGSNFPGGYDFYTLDPTSTVEYYGRSGITQTIYNGATYGSLIAKNSTGSGRAVKQTIAGTLNVATSFNINALADVYLGTNANAALGTNTSPVTCAGPLNILATGGLYCNANVVSGTGAFTMSNGSYLGMGHAEGISNSGNATGNIQMTGGRTYNSTGNYIYNGILNQVTGGGLPTTVNDLTTDNPTIVTIATKQLVNGVDSLKQGTFDIGSTTITHNGTGTLNSIGGKMKAIKGIVEMKGTSGIAQNLSGSWFVNKTISTLINGNTKGITVAADPADTLLIASALVYGAVSNSAILTNNNLTLLSRDTATAGFGTMISGNSITGKVNIERFLPARKSWRLLAAPIGNATSPTVTAAWRESLAPLTSNGYGTRITGPAGFTGLDEFTQRASMKYYDPASNNYINVSNTTTSLISNTAGYYVFVRGDRGVPLAGAAAPTILRIKGDVITGTQVVAVPAGKFVTFGNPYPSNINLKTAAKSNISNSYYAWNPNSAGSYNVGAFELYTFDNTNYLKVPGGTVRNTIQSGEAIFIQSSGVAGTLTINETDKIGGFTTPVSRTLSTAGRAGVTKPTLEINMYTKDIDSSTYLADGILMNFNDDYSSAVDNDDVRKILNAGDNIFLKNGTANLIVERRPTLKVSDTIKLSLTNTRINPYRFEFDPSALSNIGLEATLKDKFIGSETAVSLLYVTNYSFNITSDAASKVADRFMIVFKQVKPMQFVKINAVRNKNNTATVTWYTENENNIDNNKIERSVDGVNFIEIGSQMPTANNFGNPYYTFYDARASKEIIYYRIKGNAIAGNSIYSNTEEVLALEEKNNKSVNIFPNPVTNGNININFEGVAFGNYVITINNFTGQLIKSETFKHKIAGESCLIKIFNRGKGFYTANIVDETGNKKIIPFFIK